MDRKERIRYLEHVLSDIGKRSYSIDFNPLSENSINELTEFFRYLSSLFDNVQSDNPHLSNRCVYLCIERISNGEQSDVKRILCQSHENGSEFCPYFNDSDARHFCEFYHRDK